MQLYFSSFMWLGIFPVNRRTEDIETWNLGRKMVRGGFKKEKFKANGKEQYESHTKNTTTTRAEGEIES